jgi:hypothetical protein
MTLTRQEAEAELIRWVDDESSSLIQALEGMAERNEETAAQATKDNDHIHAKLFRESAASWRSKAEQLRTRWLALPEESIDVA